MGSAVAAISMVYFDHNAEIIAEKQKKLTGTRVPFPGEEKSQVIL